MTNDEALEVLRTKQSAVNTALNDINKYKTESANWLDAYKTTVKDAVKANAVIVGADLSEWEGLDV